MFRTLRSALSLVLALAASSSVPARRRSRAHAIRDSRRRRRSTARQELRHALPDVGSLRRLPQRHDDSDRRRHLDRHRLANQHDGQRGSRSVLDGGRAARNDRSSHGRRAHPGRMLDLPHADDAVRGQAGRGRRGGLRAPPARPPTSSPIGWRTTGSPARCATRSPTRIWARAKASSAASRSTRRPAPGERRVYGPFEIDKGHTTIMQSSSDVPADRGQAHAVPRSCAPRATRC